MFFATFGSSVLLHPQSEKSFLGWMRDTNQFFTGDEYQIRLGIWLQNQRFVNEHNSGDSSFTLEMNHLSHLTHTEYLSMLGHRSIGAGSENRAQPIGDIPMNKEFDWRSEGIVNPVKNQGQCGSCWAFSVIFAMESMWAHKRRELPILSEQNLVDCVTSCYGCGGGDEYVSFNYVINKQGGLWNTEKDYPYTARDGSCKFNRDRGVCKCTGWHRPAAGRDIEESLQKSLVSDGPISVAIDAGVSSFQSYRGGIYDEPRCNSRRLNHAVGLVGYGDLEGKEYWIVRNSWGPNWGEKGYIRMVRKNNQCGIASDCVIAEC